MLEAPAFQHSAFEDALRVGVIAAPSVRMLGMPRMLNADIPAFGIRHSAPQPADDATIESFNERVKCWECGACRNAGRAGIQHSAFGIPRRPDRALPPRISGDYGTEFGQRGDRPGGAWRAARENAGNAENAECRHPGIRHSAFGATARRRRHDRVVQRAREMLGMRSMPECWTRRHSAFGFRHSAFGIRHSAFSIRHSAFGIPRRPGSRTAATHLWAPSSAARRRTWGAWRAARENAGNAENAGMLEAPAFQHSAFEDALRVGVIAAPSVRMLGMPRMLNADIPAFGIRHSAPQPADDATIESFNERVKCWECGACRNAGRAGIQHSAFGIPRRPDRALPPRISGDYGTEFGQRGDRPGGAWRAARENAGNAENAECRHPGIRHSAFGATARRRRHDRVVQRAREMLGMRSMPECWTRRHSAFGIRNSRVAAAIARVG